jgi:hypothetical protein
MMRCRFHARRIGAQRRALAHDGVLGAGFFGYLLRMSPSREPRAPHEAVSKYAHRVAAIDESMWLEATSEPSPSNSNAFGAGQLQNELALLSGSPTALQVSR